MFVIMAKMKATKGNEGELENMLRKLKSLSLKNEKDIISFEMHRSLSNPAVIFLYEQYTDRDAWAITHMSMTFVKEVVEKLPDLLDGNIEITEYELIQI